MLQINEVVNVAAGFRDRYKDVSGNARCLKLLLTDGERLTQTRLRLRVAAAAPPSYTCRTTWRLRIQVTLSVTHLGLNVGVTTLAALEYRHVPCLGSFLPAGSKLLVVNPAVRRGLLLLQPENVVLLGGSVRFSLA